MKRLFTYLMLLTLLSGCSLMQENVDFEIVYAPKLDIDFKGDPNFIHYKNSRVFIYNTRNKLFLDTIISYDPSVETPANVIHGVDAGVYKMVTLSNFDNTIVTGVEDSMSVENMRIEMLAVGCDRLYINTSEHELKRGDPKVCTEVGKPLFYDLSITLTNVADMTVDPIEPYIEILGLKTHFDHGGVASDPVETSVRLPGLVTLPNKDLKTECTVVKFTDNDNITIKVKELVKETIETVEIHPGDFIDVDSKKVQKLDIVMKYKYNSFVLIVNDWVLGEFNLAEVGS